MTLGVCWFQAGDGLGGGRGRVPEDTRESGSGVQTAHTQGLGVPGCACEGNPATSLDVSPPTPNSTRCTQTGVGTSTSVGLGWCL